MPQALGGVVLGKQGFQGYWREQARSWGCGEARTWDSDIEHLGHFSGRVPQWPCFALCTI